MKILSISIFSRRMFDLDDLTEQCARRFSEILEALFGELSRQSFPYRIGKSRVLCERSDQRKGLWRHT